MIDIKFKPEKNGLLINQENTLHVLLNMVNELVVLLAGVGVIES